jgi:FixJ family two-component response regulator
MLDSIKDQTSIDFINKPFSLKDLLKLIAWNHVAINLYISQNAKYHIWKRHQEW